MTLFDVFANVKDFRRPQGQRISLAAFLEMIVLAGMSGKFSINAIARFMKNNEAFFIARYNLEHGVPSLGTVFNNMKHISYDEMNKALWIWMTQYVDKSEDLWIAIDGKALGSTSTDVQGSEQNYKSMVSMFVQSKGVVLNAVSIQLKKSNEGDAARDLIHALEAKGMTFTMDALHCQKKLLRPSWSQEMTM